MIHTNRWRPDTCGCVIEYQWDDSVSEDKRVHTPKNVSPCLHHKSGTKEEKFDKVVEENQRKNKFLSHIMENMPEVVEERSNVDGSISKRLKDSIEYTWSFDDQRNLKVDLKGLAETGRTKLKQLASSFKQGKVEVI